MDIVSHITDSFQEYEGHHSLVLFSAGCNLNCKFCYNYEEVTDKQNIKGQAIPMMTRLLNPLHEAVVFLGGEPTIHGDDLMEAMKFVKRKGLKVKLFTNGLKPNLIDDLLQEDLVEAFSVDLKTVSNDFQEVMGSPLDVKMYLYLVDKTISSILQFGEDLEIRTTEYEGLDLEAVKKYIASNYPTVKHIVTKDFREV